MPDQAIASVSHTPERCSFPPAHPSGCNCLREACPDCNHDLGGHDETGCRTSSGFLGKPSGMTPCACRRPFHRDAYLAERGLPPATRAPLSDELRAKIDLARAAIAKATGADR